MKHEGRESSVVLDLNERWSIRVMCTAEEVGQGQESRVKGV